ncbi:MAG TPA: cyclic nucleotide-binding domain-containing protein [Spirochaetota bacterium]|nr:cyclic nucleotide-binding domain-containing protein [Spirochaetota bacterium]
MAQNFLKLYSQNSEPDSAFFLNGGNVFLYASNNDKYSIKGQNLIIGSTELIMKHILGESTLRLETAVATANSKIKKIPAEKFISSINSFSFLINTSIVLAKQVLLTNKIINKNMDALEGNDRLLKDLSIKYYKGICLLTQEYEKRKLPWLNEITKKHATSLNFKRGEAFCKSQESLTVESSSMLSDRMIEYPRGSAICEENTEGEELYILQAGSIDVEIGGNRVATIDKKGTVFGEMALLLNEKRTATLRAKNNTVITKILKSELKEVCEKDNELLKNVAFSLAQKHYFNIIKIGAVNKSLIEHALDDQSGEDKTVNHVERLKLDISKLKNDIDEAIYKKEADYLRPVIDELS